MRKVLALLILVTVTLVGCVNTNSSVSENLKEGQKKRNEDRLEGNEMKTKNESNNRTSPFIVKSINSQIVSYRDHVDHKLMRAVEYKILLYTDKKLSPKEVRSFEFEIEDDPKMKRREVPIQLVTRLMLEEKRENGYLYSVRFGTVYSIRYTQKELERQKNERNFQMVAYSQGKKLSIPNK
ncbi:hypothetical protein [Priestia koreensis]|uniref:hypothetical protein n=1 Tax=Priestia koreensis TaxID=284581 RepID=UPI0028F71C00|nr:hypothetical protein [Priestia koreensis]